MKGGGVSDEAEPYVYKGVKGYRLKLDGFKALVWFPEGYPVHIEHLEEGTFLFCEEKPILLERGEK